MDKHTPEKWEVISRDDNTCPFAYSVQAYLTGWLDNVIEEALATEASDEAR